jgi:hypothetical protein
LYCSGSEERLDGVDSAGDALVWLGESGAVGMDGGGGCGTLALRLGASATALVSDLSESARSSPLFVIPWGPA